MSGISLVAEVLPLTSLAAFPLHLRCEDYFITYGSVSTTSPGVDFRVTALETSVGVLRPRCGLVSSLGAPGSDAAPFPTKETAPKLAERVICSGYMGYFSHGWKSTTVHVEGGVLLSDCHFSCNLPLHNSFHSRVCQPAPFK